MLSCRSNAYECERYIIQSLPLSHLIDVYTRPCDVSLSEVYCRFATLRTTNAYSTQYIYIARSAIMSRHVWLDALKACTILEASRRFPEAFESPSKGCLQSRHNASQLHFELAQVFIVFQILLDVDSHLTRYFVPVLLLQLLRVCVDVEWLVRLGETVRSA